MLTDQEIQAFLDSHNYDIRISGSARWIDQKLTPDVLWSISDYIVAFIQNDENIIFTCREIWDSDYAKETIKLTYSKPDVDDAKARSEYDKVFAQPMNLLCYADIIEDINNSSARHYYKVKNKEVLNYIARNDMYSYKFLVMYITKVLKDSGLYDEFEYFFNDQTPESYKRVKSKFADIYHKYTPISNSKTTEINRIFTKVINPLACNLIKRGSEKGRISKNIISPSNLMYRRDNFRDLFLNKPKNISRQQWLEIHPQQYNRGYFEQMLNNAKRQLKEYNHIYLNDVSELTKYSNVFPDNYMATQAHHIFPKNEFPTITHYLENLIQLTSNQHNLFAHPRNNTSIIDLAAQKELLIAKTYSIKDNLENNNVEHIYNFQFFLYVLSVGFSDESALEIQENDYCDVLHFINAHYS